MPAPTQPALRGEERPTRMTLVVCGILVLAAARCLRLAFLAAHQMPSYAVRYVVGVYVLFVAAFAFIITALLLRDAKISIPSLLVISPWLSKALTVLVRYAPYAVVALLVGRKIYDHYGVPYIGTDGALFSRYAVDLLLRGRNPYAESMRPAFAAYNFDAPFSTYRIDGTTVEQISYPAMSFLPFIPQALLGSRTIDCTSLIVLAVTFWWLIAKSDGLLRWGPPLLLSMHSDLLNFTAGGVFDILWVLPVLVTMHQWARGRLATAGIAYGLACSVKQTPWFIAPFLLTTLILERKNIVRFAGAAAATFIVTNLPFMVTAPRAWLAGVLTPVAGGVPLVELGEGPILLNIIGATHEPKLFFTILMALAFIVFLWCYAIYYPRTKWLGWIAPMVILWFNYRSLHNYYLFSLPLAHFAVVLRGREDCPPCPKRRPWHAVVVAAALLVSIIAGTSLPARATLPLVASSPALSDPQSIGRNGRMRLHVANNGLGAIDPIFLVTHVEHQTPFVWPVSEGPMTLAGGSSAVYTLDAPAVQATIPIGASMHLRVFDRGHSAWTSLVVAADPKSPRPLVRNPNFRALVQRSESGLYIPYEWATSPRRPSSRMYFVAASDGMHMSNADTAENTAVHQGLSVIPPSIAVDVTPMTVKAGAGLNDTPSLELHDKDRCILVRLAAVANASVRSATYGNRDCRVIDLPAKAGERLSTTLTFADFVEPEFLGAMKGTVRLLLSTGIPSDGENAIILHHVSSDMMYAGKP